MINDIKKVLISEEEINTICKKMGEQITKDYQNLGIPVFIGLLKGCVPFMTKLTSEIGIKMEIDYMIASSYHGTVSFGDVQIKKDLGISVVGRHVVIVEDIVDTGKTLKTIVELLKMRGAASIEVATLLDKPAGRVVEFNPKYVGCLVPNEFVVGFGLDYNELYRNLPYIGVLKPEIYERGDSIE